MWHNLAVKIQEVISMPQFNLYHLPDNFSEYIQDDNLHIEEIADDLSVVLPMSSFPQNDTASKEYENWVHGLSLSSPWSKWGHRHLVARMLSDFNSKKRKE